MTSKDSRPLFKPRKPLSSRPVFRKPCPCLPATRSGCPEKQTLVFLAAGMECPHCHLASLAEREGALIQCPICGYGTHRPVT
ncbi:MAG: hypothetical protein ACOYXN_03685 [Acidobacteriota bacterium]